MRYRQLPLMLALFAVALVLTGCEAKLKDQVKQKLGAGEEKELIIPKAKSERTVIAEVSATEPVTGQFFKSDDATPLASQKEKSTTFTLECKQPANEELKFLVIASNKASEVTITLTSK